jgi:hypothetical protein
MTWLMMALLHSITGVYPELARHEGEQTVEADEPPGGAAGADAGPVVARASAGATPSETTARRPRSKSDDAKQSVRPPRALGLWSSFGRRARARPTAGRRTHRAFVVGRPASAVRLL